jgi:cyanophycinase-like exopeptidase
MDPERGDAGRAELWSVVDELPAGAGAIGLLSSEEFTHHTDPFARALLEAGGPHVGILLAADPEAAEAVGRVAEACYRGLGARPVVLDVLRREHAVASALPDCDVLFLAGGDPAHLLPALRDTPFWGAVADRWRAGMVLAGASAGAMALCRHCLVPRPGHDKPTVWDRGLGPLERFGLAVHAATRPAEWVAGVAASAPVPVVAIDDATGVLLAPGGAPRVIGPGRAWVAGPSS